MAPRSNTTKPSIEDLQAAAEAAQAALAEAMEAQRKELLEVACTDVEKGLATVAGNITEAQGHLGNRDAAAAITSLLAVSQLITDATAVLREASGVRSPGRPRAAAPREGSVAEDVLRILGEATGPLTAGEIGKACGRSGGAVDQALGRDGTGLIATGKAVLVEGSKPRRYRLA